MNIAIIGCGFIGEKRAKALRGQHKLVVCCDTNLARAESLAARYPGAAATTDWAAAAAWPDVDIVCVATVHKALPEVTLAAVVAAKHVLVEKPAARRAAELEPVVEACARTGHWFGLGSIIAIIGRFGKRGRLSIPARWGR